jgi:hypothetical protein
MNCGEDGCPLCAQGGAVAALRRWNEALEAAARRQEPTAWERLQRGLGVAGYVPKEDEDDS